MPGFKHETVRPQPGVIPISYTLLLSDFGEVRLMIMLGKILIVEFANFLSAHLHDRVNIL